MIAIQIKDSKEMTICEANKGYDSKAFRQAILNKGYVPIIGYRKHTKEKASKEEIANYFGVIKKDGL